MKNIKKLWIFAVCFLYVFCFSACAGRSNLFALNDAATEKSTNQILPTIDGDPISGGSSEDSEEEGDCEAGSGEHKLNDENNVLEETSENSGEQNISEKENDENNANVEAGENVVEPQNNENGSSEQGNNEESNGETEVPQASYELVAENGENITYYESAQELFCDALVSNVKVKLLKNVVVPFVTVSSITEIDLNGFVLEIENSVVLSKGVLTIKDSSETYGRITAECISIDEGDLIVFGGTIDCDIVLNEGTVLIGGGLFKESNLEIVSENLDSGCDLEDEITIIDGSVYYKVCVRNQ